MFHIKVKYSTSRVSHNNALINNWSLLLRTSSNFPLITVKGEKQKSLVILLISPFPWHHFPLFVSTLSRVYKISSTL